MDRNEKKNSFRNTQNSRGNDREAKKYKKAFHITLAVAVVLAAAAGGLGFNTYRLSTKNESSQEEKAEEGVITIGGEKAETTEAAQAQETNVTETPKAAQKETETPSASATPVQIDAEDNTTVQKISLTNNLGEEITSIEMRPFQSLDDASEDTWQSDLWNGNFPLKEGDTAEYSVKTGEEKEFDIRSNGGYYFRDLPLNDISELSLCRDKESGLPYAEYIDKEGNKVSTLSDVKKRNTSGNEEQAETESNTEQTAEGN